MKSIAHKLGMNFRGQELYPDGLVPWDDAKPPETSGRSRSGRLRGCGYCGSMHPTDVVAAIKAGATGHWADRKYGWPHKAYFDSIPNPHAGMLEVRASCNFEKEGWIKIFEDGRDYWHEPPQPASLITSGKFYSIHLLDATQEEREIIQNHLGIYFDFKDDGTLTWKGAK